MAERAAEFRALHVDFGTGDGAFVRHVAARHADTFVIGVDAAVDALRDTSRRLAAKPARGGLPNALLGRLAVADAPGELAGLADVLTVLLPWGSLLRAVAKPEVFTLRSLRALCRSAATLQVVFGYGDAEGSAIRELELPALDGDDALRALERAYRDAGFGVAARWLEREEVGALPTTWAKKLAYSGRARRFVELRGTVITDEECRPALRGAGTSTRRSRE